MDRVEDFVILLAFDAFLDCLDVIGDLLQEFSVSQLARLQGDFQGPPAVLLLVVSMDRDEPQGLGRVIAQDLGATFEGRERRQARDQVQGLFS